MSDLSNTGHAILIVGCLYFGYAHGFDWWLIALVALAVVTWVYAGFSKERKEYFKVYIEMLRAKAEYYRKKTEVTP